MKLTWLPKFSRLEVSHENNHHRRNPLLFVTQAQAISTNFFIFFDEHNAPLQHADWSGMYTITDGRLTAFSALMEFARIH